jgi:hypothetical protein
MPLLMVIVSASFTRFFLLVHTVVLSSLVSFHSLLVLLSLLYTSLCQLFYLHLILHQNLQIIYIFILQPATSAYLTGKSYYSQTFNFFFTPSPLPSSFSPSLFTLVTPDYTYLFTPKCANCLHFILQTATSTYLTGESYLHWSPDIQSFIYSLFLAFLFLSLTLHIIYT